MAYDDEDEFDPDDVTCRKCGTEGLTLTKIHNQWVLFEHRGLRIREHKCDHSDVFDSLD